MRLWGILLPSKQRPKQLLQQPIYIQSHRLFHWRPPNNIDAPRIHNIGIANLNAVADCRHCRLYRITIRCHLISHYERLQQRKAPDRRRWRHHRRHIWRHHRCSRGHSLLDVHEREASKETEGALRGAVLPDCSISTNYCVDCLSYG